MEFNEAQRRQMQGQVFDNPFEKHGWDEYLPVPGTVILGSPPALRLLSWSPLREAADLAHMLSFCA